MGRATSFRSRCAGLAICLWQTIAAPAHAQVVERHLPPPPAPTAPTLATPLPPVAAGDDRALGAVLHAIVLLGPSEAVQSGPANGVVVSSALPRMDRESAQRTIRAFLGEPITRRLISRIEAAIVNASRRQGFPFVEVSTPEQEISGGVLQIRVVEFRLGKLNLAGASPREAARIAGAVRLVPGGEIDSRRLSQDLDWLGRTPFRTIAPAFTPGAELGQTDLDLAVTHLRPWRVEAGYSNSGASPTDQDRYFVGATAGGVVIADSVLSLQITGSPDFWVTGDEVLVQSHPTYESVAGRFTAPLTPRSDIELSLDAVETNQAVPFFVVREQTLETSLAWRTAVSNFVPLPGDVRLGIEAKAQRRMTFFGPVDVLEGGVNIYQILGGWSESWNDRFGHSTLDLAIHVAPGGVDRLNSDANFSDFTSGRVGGAGYAYLDIDYGRLTTLPRGLSLATQLTAQYAGRPIPDSEQLGLGGQGLVRGYFLDVGAFDDAVILRDELHAPALAVVKSAAAPVAVAPFAFLDLGWGRNEAAGQNVRLASVGLGADLQVTRRIAADLSLSYPLARVRETHVGDWRLEARLAVSY
ncbi:MAG TPA: ShlB/FhaC/HecB family hemolysin secretion/activation protein [Caulobacteraceae bacterium]